MLNVNTIAQMFQQLWNSSFQILWSIRLMRQYIFRHQEQQESSLRVQCICTHMTPGASNKIAEQMAIKQNCEKHVNSHSQ